MLRRRGLLLFVAAVTLQREQQQGRDVWRFVQNTRRAFDFFRRMGTCSRDLIGSTDLLPSGRFKIL